MDTDKVVIQHVKRNRVHLVVAAHYGSRPSSTMCGATPISAVPVATDPRMILGIELHLGRQVLSCHVTMI
jgi:hypothetical protein